MQETGGPQAGLAGSATGHLLKGESGWPVPGMNVPYEEPISPEIIIETSSTSVEAATNIISEHIKKLLR